MPTYSAVASKKANGDKNGWSADMPSSEDQLDEIYDYGVRSSGVVTGLPVCGWDESFDNWTGRDSRDDEWDLFPCDKV